MPSSVRLLSSLAMLVFALGAVVLVIPEVPYLGPALSFEAAQAMVMGLVTHPAFLAPLGLAAVFFVYVKTRPLPQGRIRGSVFLPQMPPHLASPERLKELRARLLEAKPTADGMSFLDLLVHAAVQARASDIHIHAEADGAEVNLRVDGLIEPVSQLGYSLYAAVINRLKVLARLTHYVTDKPQDGQFSLATPDGTAEVRVSLLPTQHGEKAVLRLAGLANRLPELGALHLPQSVHTQLTRMLTKPQGLIFFTGPVGSGKTTSIYASVTHLQQSRGSLAQIASIEDPIEHAIPKAAQTQVNRATGLDFASGLRALLRQDPNVIVVGEIRDVETARIATQAALTGHLILTTVHADSAPGVFTRLLEMGVEASVLSSVSLACFSQRLVRRLCPHCRAPQTPTVDQVQRLKSIGAPTDGYFVSLGCADCGHTGSAGRTAIFEVLIVGDRIREALLETPNTQRLMALSVEEGLVPLRDAALKAARAGEVSLAEALRIST